MRVSPSGSYFQRGLPSVLPPPAHVFFQYGVLESQRVAGGAYVFRAFSPIAHAMHVLKPKERGIIRLRLVRCGITYYIVVHQSHPTVAAACLGPTVSDLVTASYLLLPLELLTSGV